VLFSSTSGHRLLREAIALGATTIALVLAVVWRRAWSIVVLGLAAADSMFIHAWNSHASASSPVWFNVGDQWLHLLSVATWVGGLVWLLIGLRGRPEEERPAISRRFSWLAGIALAVVAATGITRAIDEVGPPQHWSRLYTTSFGVTLLVKLGLFVALVAFGARNRYVNVPGLTRGTKKVGSLRRTVVAEILIAAGVLGATGVLSELAPAASVAASSGRQTAGPTKVVATGHDLATTVRIRLTVTPGTVGVNRFVADVVDYDTGHPVNATGVMLTFTLHGNPNIDSTLALHRSGSTWTASSTVLSMQGRWNVQALVQEPSGGVQVPLTVQTRMPQEQIQVSPGAGSQPTLYTIQLAGGNSLQGYLDRKGAGPNTAHFTFFSASGNELAISSAQGSEITPSGTVQAVKLLRLSKGHFVANVALNAGHWTFLIEATSRQGAGFFAYYAQTIGG
jgi:putative copper export protein